MACSRLQLRNLPMKQDGWLQARSYFAAWLNPVFIRHEDALIGTEITFADFWCPALLGIAT
jgi:hypothetical protein